MDVKLCLSNLIIVENRRKFQIFKKFAQFLRQARHSTRRKQLYGKKFWKEILLNEVKFGKAKNFKQKIQIISSSYCFPLSHNIWGLHNTQTTPQKSQQTRFIQYENCKKKVVDRKT